MVTPGAPTNRPTPWPLILKVGLIAGTLDITDAVVFSHFRGVGPARVFQYIERVDRDTSIFNGDGVHCSWSASSLCHRAWMDGDFLPGKSKGRDLAPSARDEWGRLRGCRVFVYEPGGSALVGRAHPIKAATLASRINGVLAVVLFIGLTISLLIRRNTLSS